MPEYLYQCPFGHRMSRFTNVKNHLPFVDCEHCGVIAAQVITAPLMLRVAENVAYDSPIDGKIINSWQARQEDLKRNNCTPYDPEQRTDYHTRIKESESSLEKSIAATVEETIEKMPTQKRGKLYSELTEQGMTADVVTGTYEG